MGYMGARSKFLQGPVSMDNQTTLDRVLAHVFIGIESGKDLLEIIPDSPFPAHSLIKAPASLAKLGVV